MPTYVYECTACKKEVEYFQSMTEAPKRKCPSCGKQKLSRKIGAGAGILFKGSGFYQTDYRSDSYKKGESADKPSATPASDIKPSSSEAPKGDASSKPTAEPAAKPKKKGKD
jgi:putative FmdB family regulatory protein